MLRAPSKQKTAASPFGLAAVLRASFSRPEQAGCLGNQAI